MMNELFVNGELMRSRKETHSTGRHPTKEPVILSKMDGRITHFDIRNVMDLKAFLKEIQANWHTYVSQVTHWIRKNPVKKLIVTGIFTVMLGFFSNAASAAFIQEYTYQVKAGDKIEKIAAAHGITAQEILEANGISSIDGKKILLPKVQDRIVTATILNIRSHPSTESSILGQYQKGDVVKVAFIENGWAGILIKGRVCFLSAKYLAQQQPESQAGNSQIKPLSVVKTMYVTATSLRIRKAASTNSAILGLLTLNDQVSVVATANGWAQIHWNHQTAFVSTTYLTHNEPVNIQTGTVHNSQASSSAYVIKQGDTFTKISQLFGVSVSSIQKLNPAVDSSKLKIGQIIKIPAVTVSATYQLKVKARIETVTPQGICRFITSAGKTYDAKAPESMLTELVRLEGKQLTLVLEGKRGQQMNVISFK